MACLSARRIDALTDGICAVATTWLVIELKPPERGAIHSCAEFTHATLDQWPRFHAWLAFISLMRFSPSVLGAEYTGFLAHAVFAANMTMLAVLAVLAVLALLASGYVYRRPELSTVPIQSVVEGGGAGFGNIAFVPMAVIEPLSCRVERASDRAGPRPALR